MGVQFTVQYERNSLPCQVHDLLEDEGELCWWTLDFSCQSAMISQELAYLSDL